MTNDSNQNAAKCRLLAPRLSIAKLFTYHVTSIRTSKNSSSIKQSFSL